jgi:hypothetical protein
VWAGRDLSIVRLWRLKMLCFQTQGRTQVPQEALSGLLGLCACPTEVQQHFAASGEHFMGPASVHGAQIAQIRIFSITGAIIILM